MATVSIYITTKDRPELLTRAINSVIEQTYRHIELLIVDDGSSCNNEHIIQEIRQRTDIPIRYFRNERSRGACYSRNLAIRAAEGKYITGLDDDDEFVKDRIELMVKHYDPQYAFVGSNDFLIKKNGTITSTNRPQIMTAGQLLDCCQNLVGNQVLTEKYKLEMIGGFDEQFPAFQDFDTFYRLIRQFGNGYILPNKLQNIYRNDTVIKISTLSNQFFGIIHFFLKHRADMNQQQRKAFILRYRLMKVKLLGIKSSRLKAMDIFRYSEKNALKNNFHMYIGNYLFHLKSNKLTSK